MKCDFSGYATRANVRCADGRVILKDAFKDQSGAKVPVVWQHQRDDPENVLGHGILENRADGVYIYGFLNDTRKANQTRALLEHGDIEGLSIFANQLVENRKQVSHGIIREVSIVIAPANPGAFIQNVTIQHGDDTIIDDEAAVISLTDDADIVCHADDEDDDGDGDNGNNGKTVKDVYNTLNDDQKKLFFAAMAHALAVGDEDDDDASHSDDEDPEDEGGNNTMKVNAFEHNAKEGPSATAFTREDVKAIFESARKYGSLKEATKEYVVEHSAEHGIEISDASLEHGIEELEILFPEAKAISPTPEMIMRQQEWVPKVWGATRKSPFSRIKTVFADITKEEARARGYIKGNKKVEEQFGLLKRVTTPQTVYKLQKLDRDDIIDITDFNVVSWLKAEMRLMLNEELARAVIIGDGRPEGDDKIKESNIRPVWKDEDLYTIKAIVDKATYEAATTNLDKSDLIIDTIAQAMDDYEGSGSPVAFLAPGVATMFKMARDKIGRRLYNTDAEIASAMGVREIITVPVMKKQVRDGRSDGDHTSENGKHYELKALIVNLSDYTVGADRGGAVTMFDDFDIDFNKYTYLIETRCSGALTKPHSAIAVEVEVNPS